MQQITCVALVAAAAISSLNAQSAPKPPASPRIYVIDCGVIKGMAVTTFGFKEGEVPPRDFFVPCYLITHPRGALMWDVGTIADSEFPPGGGPASSRNMTVNRPLMPQLAEIGYKPSDIQYFAMSHYHSDHTANANAFAGSIWLVRQAELDVMFAEKPVSIMQQASFAKLKDAKKVVLKDDEYDVFGDKTVIIKSAPGHTPGHQVVFVNLKNTGPILIAGDLYHYPEEATMNRFPTFEFNKEQSAVARKEIDAFLKKTKATMWIEHDAATNAKLKKAPGYYD